MCPPSPAHKSLYADDPLMAPLLVDFVARLAAQVLDIRTAIAADDPASLCRILHQLKGSGRSFGFPPISSHAAAADDKLRAHLPISAVYTHINDLLGYIEHIDGYKPL